MTTLMIGDDLELAVVKDRAKLQVMQAFVAKAEADAVPATLRAMYVLKVAEARQVLAGGASDYISGEAELRGLAPELMAKTIVDLSEQSIRLELERMRLNVLIENAGSFEDVGVILAVINMELSM